MSSKPLRIAIIGAGPGGLTLLNVLARHGISATVYEREEEIYNKSRLGGCLDLHPESGQVAVKAAGLWDEFMKHARLEAQEVKASDRTGVPFFHFVPPPDFAARPEIDRVVLRQLLLDNAPEGSVKWNHTFIGASPVPGTAEWEITLSSNLDEVKVTVDLVVGADGGRSHVRPLVSDATVAYTGVTGVAGVIDSDDLNADLLSKIGNGSMMAFDDGKAITTQRNGDGRVRVSAMFRSDKEYVFPNLGDPAGAVADVLARFDGWAPWLLNLMDVANLGSVVPRSYHMLPVGHTWPHRAGVTLLGDAMNLMSPYAGAGANVAMLAAAKLGTALAEAHGRPAEEVDMRIADYEKEICQVAAAEAGKSAKNMRMFMFGEEGAREFVANLGSKA
ncbi:FAD/NAD(P)-binding domain-containing protein [Auricularia subglabra TFB-10046 SS5]|nr:FAD/NAD(P)-binding domain-containing protein [Auricularia subglabra TFB-10046 SS5]